MLPVRLQERGDGAADSGRGSASPVGLARLFAPRRGARIFGIRRHGACHPGDERLGRGLGLGGAHGPDGCRYRYPPLACPRGSCGRSHSPRGRLLEPGTPGSRGMRILARFLLLICALSLASLSVSNVAYASERRGMGDVVVEKDKTVEEASTGWGDVLVEGEVKEDVSSGFGDIRIEGPVGGDVRAGSGDVHINAPIGGDVKVGHGDVYLEDGAHVGGEVSLGNGNLYRDQEAVADTERAGMASSFDEVSSSEVFSDTIGWIVMTLGLVAAAVLLAVVARVP